MSTDVADVELEEEELEEEETTTRRVRSRLSESNTYCFAPEDIKGAKANKIEKDDGSQASNFRIFKITKKGKDVNLVYGITKLDALGRYAQGQGLEVESAFPKKRGSSGPRTAIVNPLIMDAMKSMVATYPDKVREFLSDDKNEKYREELDSLLG